MPKFSKDYQPPNRAKRRAAEMKAEFRRRY
jgi:hypothetical protein